MNLIHLKMSLKLSEAVEGNHCHMNGGALRKIFDVGKHILEIAYISGSKLAHLAIQKFVQFCWS